MTGAPFFFTVAALLAVSAVGYFVNRGLTKEKDAPRRFEDDTVRQSVVFARDDLKLIALLLAAILIMLGVIADRI